MKILVHLERVPTKYDRGKNLKIHVIFSLSYLYHSYNLFSLSYLRTRHQHVVWWKPDSKLTSTLALTLTCFPREILRMKALCDYCMLCLPSNVRILDNAT